MNEQAVMAHDAELQTDLLILHEQRLLPMRVVRVTGEDTVRARAIDPGDLDDDDLDRYIVMLQWARKQR